MSRLVLGEQRGQVQKHFNVDRSGGDGPLPSIDQQQIYVAEDQGLCESRTSHQIVAQLDELVASLLARAFRGDCSFCWPAVAESSRPRLLASKHDAHDARWGDCEVSEHLGPVLIWRYSTRYRCGDGVTVTPSILGGGLAERCMRPRAEPVDGRLWIRGRVFLRAPRAWSCGRVDVPHDGSLVCPTSDTSECDGELAGIPGPGGPAAVLMARAVKPNWATGRCTISRCVRWIR